MECETGEGITDDKRAGSPSSSLGSENGVALEIDGAVLGVLPSPRLGVLRHGSPRDEEQLGVL